MTNLPNINKAHLEHLNFFSIRQLSEHKLIQRKINDTAKGISFDLKRSGLVELNEKPYKMSLLRHKPKSAPLGFLKQRIKDYPKRKSENPK